MTTEKKKIGEFEFCDYTAFGNNNNQMTYLFRIGEHKALLVCELQTGRQTRKYFVDAEKRGQWQKVLVEINQTVAKVEEMAGTVHQILTFFGAKPGKPGKPDQPSGQQQHLRTEP